MLRNLNLTESSWETVLLQSLHAVRSLLYKNVTPHERFSKFHRRTLFPTGCLPPEPALLRRFIETKNQSLLEVVELIKANLNFAII